MNCLWIVDPGNSRRKSCRRAGCGNTIETDHEPAYCFARCKGVGDYGPCAHLGDELRRENCPTCSGHVQVKVFACAARGECTLAKVVGEIACCQGCGEFKAGELPPVAVEPAR